MKSRKLKIILVSLTLFAGYEIFNYLYMNVSVPTSVSYQPGDPLPGLTSYELSKFNETRELFKHKFTVQEGLGPLFNGESCFECHGQPSSSVGGEGRDTSSTSILNFGRRLPLSPRANKPLADVAEVLTRRDVDFFLERGGPSLQRKSITTENPELFPFELQLNFETLPVGTEILSFRHSPPLFGDGLIDNIPDSEIISNAVKQSIEHPDLAGRPISQVDRYTELARVGRFGWKNQMVNLLNFTTAAMNIELGVTTYLNQTENSPKSMGMIPIRILKKLPPSPNDKGKVLVGLTFFQSMLAPPPRGEITPEVQEGEALFKKLDCAVCHIPQMHTAPEGIVVSPDSPLPALEYLKVKALSNKPVNAYSDFLLHRMGKDLADGIPQEGAVGGEWRTTPLWGLRFKKFYLHDGRTTDLEETIVLHGGQSAPSTEQYKKLSREDKASLLAFLRSL